MASGGTIGQRPVAPTRRILPRLPAFDMRAWLGRQGHRVNWKRVQRLMRTMQREQAVLLSMTQGLTNSEIGNELSLAEGTVKNYVTAILQKLGVRDRTQAALRAREMGLFNDSTS